MAQLTESVVEDAALAWLDSLGYTILPGPDIAPDMPAGERHNYRDVVLERRLRQALARLNPNLPAEAVDDAFRKLTRTDAPSLLERNRAVHRMLVDGVTVEYRRRDGSIAGAQARVLDFGAPENNDWLAINQFTVAEGQHTRRPDVVLFVNGLPRIKLIARDLADHFENRLATIDGKAMVVCMSRRICVELYREIAALRPAWRHEDDDKGTLKVVMTGSASDPTDWQLHIRNKPRREALAQRFRDPADPFKIVIVRDMWLTGFDAPSLHTMYMDKPMRGHGLMQAIARVNRVFKDKPGGLVVDYLGLADELKAALATWQHGRCVPRGLTVLLRVDRRRVLLYGISGRDRWRLCPLSKTFRAPTGFISTALTATSPSTFTSKGNEWSASLGLSRLHWPRTTASRQDSSTAFARPFKRTWQRFRRRGVSIVVSTDARVKDVKVTDELITFYLVDGRVVSVPLAWSWRLSEATPDQRSNFEIIGDGHGVHWPDIDEDLSVEGMFHGVPARRAKK